MGNKARLPFPGGTEAGLRGDFYLLPILDKGRIGETNHHINLRNSSKSWLCFLLSTWLQVVGKVADHADYMWKCPRRHPGDISHECFLKYLLHFIKAPMNTVFQRGKLEFSSLK